MNKVTLPIKGFAAFPFFLAEAAVRKLAGEKNLDGKKFVVAKPFMAMAPFQCALDDAEDQLKKDYREIARTGEDSDEEWINDNDPKLRGASTGKGLRHKFL